MTVKIFLNDNNSCEFQESNGIQETVPCGSLKIRSESGRVHFSYAKTGEVFRDYGVSEVQNEAGVAYGSYAAIKTALADLFSTAPELDSTGVSAIVGLSSLVDSGNSTVTPLGIGGIFTGEWVDTSVYGTAIIGICTDVNSALNGLKIQYSADRITVCQDDEFTIIGGNPKTFSVGMANRFMRVHYTNGGTIQGIMNIQTILKTASIKDSTMRISDPIVGDDDATLTKAVVTGLRDDGIFGNAILDNENRLQVNSQPYLFGVAEGAISGHKAIRKCGIKTSIAAGVESTIWDGDTALYTYLESAEILKIVSTSANDTALGSGCRTLLITGLDANYLEISETVNMAGLTPVSTTKSFIRVFDIIVATNGTSRTNEGIITAKNNASTITLRLIAVGRSRSKTAMWTVPAGKVAYITQLQASSDTAKGATVDFYTRQMDGGITYPWVSEFTSLITGGSNVFPFNIPIKVLAKNDIGIRFLTPSNAGVTQGGATIELWYENA